MPKVLPEYLELRRQQILDAAAACFARRGFHPTTMQDICQEAELSPGAVYRYFPSKESIIEAMCDRGHTQNAQALEAAFTGGGPTLKTFDELIRVFFLEMGNFKDEEICALTVELVAEAPRNEHIRQWLTRNNHDVRAPLKHLVERAQAAGEIDASLSSDAVTRVMYAVFMGLVTQKLVEPDVDVEGYAGVLRSLFGGTFWRGNQTEAAEQVDPQAALQH